MDELVKQCHLLSQEQLCRLRLVLKDTTGIGDDIAALDEFDSTRCSHKAYTFQFLTNTTIALRLLDNIGKPEHRVTNDCTEPGFDFIVSALCVFDSVMQQSRNDCHFNPLRRVAILVTHRVNQFGHFQRVNDIRFARCLTLLADFLVLFMGKHCRQHENRIGLNERRNLDGGRNVHVTE